MKWRVEIDTSFDTKDEVIAFANLIEELKAKIFKGTGSEQIPIVTRCRYHKCYHDEAPPQACGPYVNVNFDDPTINEHLNESDEKILISDIVDSGTQI